MTAFEYEALDANANLARGVIEAASRRDAVRQLEARALQPTRIEPARRRAARGVLRRKPSAREQAKFVRQLATLLSAGLTLEETLRALREAQSHPALDAAVGALSQRLRRGERFAPALKDALPDLPVYVGRLAEVGEETGELAENLTRAADQLDYDLDTSAQVRSALTYPTLLIVTGIGAVGFMFTAVVPRFADLVEGDAEGVPLVSRIVIRSGLMVSENAAVVGLGLVALVLAAAAISQNQDARQAVFSLLLGLPLVGGLLRGAETGRWAGLMGTLLAARVPLTRALAMAEDAVRYRAMRLPLGRAAREVKTGAPLSAALSNFANLDRGVIDLIRVGEASGTLDRMLTTASGLYAKESAERTKRVLSLIEPLAILIIGGIVGLIVISIILALTSAYDVAQ